MKQSLYSGTSQQHDWNTILISLKMTQCVSAGVGVPTCDLLVGVVDLCLCEWKEVCFELFSTAAASD